MWDKQYLSIKLANAVYLKVASAKVYITQLKIIAVSSKIKVLEELIVVMWGDIDVLKTQTNYRGGKAVLWRCYRRITIMAVKWGLKSDHNALHTTAKKLQSISLPSSWLKIKNCLVTSWRLSCYCAIFHTKLFTGIEILEKVNHGC